MGKTAKVTLRKVVQKKDPPKVWEKLYFNTNMSLKLIDGYTKNKKEYHK